jgi:hypothetical protein
MQGLAHNPVVPQCQVDIGNSRPIPLPEAYLSICRTQFPQCPTFAAVVNAREHYRWTQVHQDTTR